MVLRVSTYIKNVDQNNISDEGVELLAKLPLLVRLSICIPMNNSGNTKITKRGLSRLGQLRLIELGVGKCLQQHRLEQLWRR